MFGAAAQKAEITAHSVPQNVNLGANLEKFEFFAHKAYPELKKQLYSSIWCARFNGDVCWYVAIKILEKKSFLNLYSAHSVP